MNVNPYHVFVCDQQKPEGVPCCSARGSAPVIELLRAQVAKQGLLEKVQVTVCGSLGLCERGPNMVVYPEGTWYSGVQPSDVEEIVRCHFGQGIPVERLVNHDPAAVRAEIATNRNRMLNALREQDAAGALPDPLNQSIRGYQESRVILTALELDVFNAIGENGATAAEVAKAIGAAERSTAMLLNALTAMSLVRKIGESFENTPQTRRYFTTASQDDCRLAMLHSVHLWNTWSSLTDSVRAGTAAGNPEQPDRGDNWTEAFIAAMHHNAAARAPLVVRATGADGIHRMLDIGGGSAAYSIAFAKANPDLRAEVFDLAGVLPIAQRHIRSAGVTGQVITRMGDLRRDHFGAGYDLVFVSAICHMLSEAENLDLLTRCRAALNPGGRVVIQDFILNDAKTAPKTAALFALNMLVGTQAGSSYSEGEYRQWLTAAGFSDVRWVRLPGPTGLMIGATAAS